MLHRTSTEYPINEIFYSLQGEGFNTGTPSVFVRFAACNLHCEFCDTNFKESKPLSFDEIVAEVNAYPQAPLVVLTGGEPTLFVDNDFVVNLKKATSKKICIETNGTRVVPDSVDWITLSPKTAFAGGDAEPCVMTRCDELKVVFKNQNLEQYDNIVAAHRFLQPCFSNDLAEFQRNIESCVEAVLKNSGWRLSYQLHRALNIK